LTRDQTLETQRLLKQKGFDVREIDGIMGPRTRRAVIAFQRQQGLDSNGQIDVRTADALGLSITSTTARNPHSAASRENESSGPPASQKRTGAHGPQSRDIPRR
jgi:peptidoglycan hydrolase-like protein with peptidoglycan-binding domain